MYRKTNYYSNHKCFYFTHEKIKFQNKRRQAIECKGNLVHNELGNEGGHCLAEGNSSFDEKKSLRRLPAGGKRGNVIKVLSNHRKPQCGPKAHRRMHRLNCHVKNEGIQQPIYNHAAKGRQKPADMDIPDNKNHLIQTAGARDKYNQEHQGESTKYEIEVI